MSYRLWVSDAPTASRIVRDQKPDSDWIEIGEVESSREDAFRACVQQALGLKRGRPARSVDFYADLDANHPWTKQLVNDHPDAPRGFGVDAKTAPRFRIAIQARHDGRVLFGTGEARLAVLQRRPPEQHPGQITETCIVGVKLRAAKDEPLLAVVSG